jgi:hypothetical protein
VLPRAQTLDKQPCDLVTCEPVGLGCPGSFPRTSLVSSPVMASSSLVLLRIGSSCVGDVCAAIVKNLCFSVQAVEESFLRCGYAEQCECFISPA